MHLNAAPAWTFKGIPKEKTKFNPPGPGTYNPSTKPLSNFEATPTYRIGTSSRDSFKIRTVPGPGTYSVSQIRPHSSAPIVGSSKRPALNINENPGPGTYEITQKAVEGPKFTMLGRDFHRTNKKSPGPGHYEIEGNDNITKEKAPAFVIGTASRTDRPGSGYIPGPGAYDTRGKEIGPKWRFGTESKNKLFRERVPGPGSYQIPNTLAKTSYSITGRKYDKDSDNFPGPGTYNITARPKSPSWTMAKTPKLDFNNGLQAKPGPGTYSHKGGFTETGVIFGTSTRPPLSYINHTPGPGEYAVTSNVEAPAFTMRPRTGVNKASNVPGPGHYDPKDNQSDPKWSVGRDKKGLDYDLKKSSSMPGPGFYNTARTLGGPKWGFGSSSRNKSKKNNMPGPGAYEIYSSLANLPAYADPKG